MTTEIVIKCKWSDAIGEDFIRDFVKVQNEVFHNNYSIEYFNHKYKKNIYGQSVLCVAYIKDKPVAARSLWRNDILGKESYQPVDTCVLSECRGNGVFSKMTTAAIAMLPQDTIVYNFPNHNSFPGYIKLGWIEKSLYHMVLLNNDAYRKEHPGDIDSDYFEWWIKPTKKLYYIKKGRVHYIVAPTTRKFCYVVIGSIAEHLAIQLPKLKGFNFIFFKSKRLTFYNKRFAGSHVVSTNTALSYIPVWKIDALV